MKIKRLRKQKTSVYRGHLSGSDERFIVATNPNEAYAIMLDSIFGKKYDKNEVYADPEPNKFIQAYFKRYPTGAYDTLCARELIENLKII